MHSWCPTKNQERRHRRSEEVNDPIQNNWIYLTANYLLFIPCCRQRLDSLQLPFHSAPVQETLFNVSGLTSSLVVVSNELVLYRILIDCVITIIFNTYWTNLKPLAVSSPHLLHILWTRRNFSAQNRRTSDKDDFRVDERKTKLCSIFLSAGEFFDHSWSICYLSALLRFSCGTIKCTPT